jgi:molybdenum cofactor cytidylyltransferase
MSLSKPKPTIGLILLAAGASLRMGSPKQLLEFEGQSLIRYAVQNALRSRCFPIVVVLGANNELIKTELTDLPVFIAENPDWEEGMGSSIRQGLELLQSVHPHVKAVVVMLCDQPFVKTPLINMLVEEFEQNNIPMIACAYGGTIGVPALFSNRFFPELSALDGNEGAKNLILTNQNQSLAIPFPEGNIDIDTPEDYLGLQQY